MTAPASRDNRPTTAGEGRPRRAWSVWLLAVVYALFLAALAVMAIMRP
jgi:hypothetical protein